jgi:hypothetical protein
MKDRRATGWLELYERTVNVVQAGPGNHTIVVGKGVTYRSTIGGLGLCRKGNAGSARRLRHSRSFAQRTLGLLHGGEQGLACFLVVIAGSGQAG